MHSGERSHGASGGVVTRDPAEPPRSEARGRGGLV